MNKPKTKRTITLDAITKAFAERSVSDARAILYDRIGAALSVAATVEKTIRRDGSLKLLLRNSNYLIFADFNDLREQNKVKARKVKKGSKVAITGDFRTAGYCALTMNNARLIY